MPELRASRPGYWNLARRKIFWGNAVFDLRQPAGHVGFSQRANTPRFKGWLRTVTSWRSVPPAAGWLSRSAGLSMTKRWC